MITFSQLGRFGRLGNQLWQYAAMKGISLKTGQQLKIPNPLYMSYQQQQCLLVNFNITCEYLDDKDFILYKYDQQGDPQLYDERVYGLPSNTDCISYFQNTKYFSEFEDQIKKELSFKDEVPSYKNKAQGYIQSFRNRLDKPIDLVALHVKRGEFYREVQETGINFYGPNDNLTDDSIYGSYLNKSLEYFRSKLTNPVFWVVTYGKNDFNKFGDNPIPDMEWCRNNIRGDDIYYCETNDAMMDFAIMTLSDHNLLCHCTTFGWWAGYLNPNPNKIVVAPKYYFVDQAKIVDGYYPKDFVLL